MAPTVLQTARIFEDPEPAKSPTKSHKRTTSVGDVLRGRRKEPTQTKSKFVITGNQASPSPLGERHVNSPPQPKKIPLKDETESRPSMHKKTASATSIKGFLMGRDKSSDGQAVLDKIEISSKKNRSSTNLAGLLKKRSRRELQENDQPMSAPSSSIFSGPSPSSIWPQTQPSLFVSNQGTYVENYRPSAARYSSEEEPHHIAKAFLPLSISSPQEAHGNSDSLDEIKLPQRPFLAHRSSNSSIFTENLDDEKDLISKQSLILKEPVKVPSSRSSSDGSRHDMDVQAASPEKPETRNRASRIFDTIATLNMRPRKADASSSSQEHNDKEPLSPQDIDSAMENMLGRYDVPQNLRDQLRNLKPEVKAGLMKGERIGSGSSAEGDGLRSSVRRMTKAEPESRNTDDKNEKRSRSRSRPRSRILSLTRRGEASPTKQDSSIRSRSKSRPKSVDMSRPSSSSATSSTVSLGSLAMHDSATTPGDFIHYLREVQKPALVEIGKIHKLRVLLRNESVAWTDAFVRKGGMDEIVNLLYRIIRLEWREEHEDMLLHHCLSCLKGLSTTLLAMQRLEALSAELFPTLLKMLFDPERKGPAEYPTRGVVISLVFSYLSATLHGDAEVHSKRAQEVLSLMRDSGPVNAKEQLDFVSQMYTSRPYRVWCKEVSNVTKEVFWIFLHHLNAIPVLDTVNEAETTFARSYFPAARAPHPAAPYVGGVEWEATQYLATHLDLLNGIIASLPTARHRNEVREDLRQSGWEKVMGGSLRTCKEKFYAGVHDGLKAWVAAAKQDGWYVEDVRVGPPRNAISPRKSTTKTQADEAPKITLDVQVPALSKTDDVWL